MRAVSECKETSFKAKIIKVKDRFAHCLRFYWTVDNNAAVIPYKLIFHSRYCMTHMGKYSSIIEINVDASNYHYLIHYVLQQTTISSSIVY